MNNTEFENRMFAHVNQNCANKELDRQEVERAAWEEYQYRCKCKKINAVIGIIVWTLCFAAILFAVWVLTWLGRIPAEISIIVMAVVGYVVGMSINALGNRIKK